jgi:23S rRNA pseudoU1915 N3-methylase RlmH
MNSWSLWKRDSPAWLVLVLLAGSAAASHPGFAQNADMQQRIAELKAASAQNKQNLATYTWQEQDTTSIKGEVKKQESYQVRMGADGKPAKTPLNPTAAPAAPPQAGGRGGRLKEKVVENKKEEFQDYAQSVAALAHSYSPPDPAKLQQAQQQGNIKMSPGATPDEVQIVISNYNKPNDSMTIAFDKTAKAIQSVTIASYLDSPKDAVNVAVQFSKLPDGTNHVASMVVDGVSKQLKVQIANSGYTKM